MKMQEFYKKYNLNKSYFATIAGVSAKTVDKFDSDISIRENSRNRIEKAIYVIEKYSLVRPKYEHLYHGFMAISYNQKFNKSVMEYTERCKRLIAREP